MPSASAANAAAASFAALVAQLSYLSAADIDLVRKAYRFADEAHLGQLRKMVSLTSHIQFLWPRNAPNGNSMLKL